MTDVAQAPEPFAAIPAVPMFMRTVKLTLKIGAAAVQEFQCHVTSARIAVEPGDTVTVKTLCTDGVFSQPGSSSYSLILEGVQDYAANGLARYLWTNQGQIADFVLQGYGETVAASASTPQMTGQVVLIAGDYGGEIEDYGRIEVELPCVSKPTLATT
jgi:hypothetical protein